MTELDPALIEAARRVYAVNGGQFTLAALASIRAMLTYLRDHPTAAQIEAMARELATASNEDPDGQGTWVWSKVYHNYLGRARAAHRALFDAILRETTDGT